MVAPVRCSRLISVAIAVLVLRANGAIDLKSNCFRNKNAIEYESDRCIFVEHWHEATMREAEAACRNLSGDLRWNLPEFNSENASKWKSMSLGIAKLLSTKKAVFWIGLVRKNETWRWLIDDSVLDETKAMWKNGSERSDSGDCALAEWDRQSGSMKWTGTTCHNPSIVGISTLICESTPRSEPRAKSKRKRNNFGMERTFENATTTASSEQPSNGSRHLMRDPTPNTDLEPWDQYGKWVLLGVCLAVIAALVIVGSVFYVRRRRRIHLDQVMARRDSLSSTSLKSTSTKTDDSLSDFFDTADKRKAVGPSNLETPKILTAAHKQKRGKRDSTDTSSDSEYVSFTAMSYSF